MDKSISIESLESQAQAIRRRMNEDAAQLNLIESLLNLSKKYFSSSRMQPIGGALQMVSEKLKKGSDTLTKKERIVATAEGVLSDGVRRFSRELLNDLKAHGVEVGGKDEVLNLSSYLSREKSIFSSDQKQGGWTLVRLLKKARPSEVPASPGLFSNGAEATHHAVSARKEDAELG